MSGYGCNRRLRREDDVPIVVVRARDDTHDVVRRLRNQIEAESGNPRHPVTVRGLGAKLQP
ncbi:hypothetical protein OHA21_15055 [Actinoplanes sp. NBC_00393]|uniref:hypothetical protein n=1 Tax=Actinoplanes sp. NBC_00393 TaxID=2975953 RepID=UPI002E1D1892